VSRLFSTLAAVAVLALVLWWLLTPSLASLDLGPGDELRACPGAPIFVVRRGDSWYWLPAGASQASQAQALPDDLLDPPALCADGTLLLHLPGRLLRQAPDGTRSELTLPAAGSPGALGSAGAGAGATAMGAGAGQASADPTPPRLLGVDPAGQPVLSQGDPPRLWVAQGESWLPLIAGDVWASPPADASVLLSGAGPVLAYRGLAGWEAWSWDAGQVRRVLADACVGQDAVFTPDGAALVVEGRSDGLFRLDLASGGLAFMSNGNLGASQRVPFSAAYRGDPLLLNTSQRDREGFLQIFQNQLTGGARGSMTSGGLHHYLPAAAPDGRLLAYVQASFDEQGSDAFEESVYMLDFEQKLADEVLRRPGGRLHQGPVFVGRGSTLILLAGGRVHAIRP